MKEVEDIMKPIAPFLSEKFDEFEDQEKQDASHFGKVKMHAPITKEQAVTGK